MTSAVIEERADIEAQTAGMTFCRLLQKTVADYGDEPAYSDRDGDAPWQTLTWRQFREQVLRLAAALVRLGLEPGDRVGLMLPNRIEHVLADQAVLHAGGVPVTFYATLAPDQIRYIASDCQVQMAVLDGASELARWEPLLADLPSLRTVIVRDAGVCPADDRHLTWDALTALGDEASGDEAAEVTRRIDSIQPADPVTLLYTSGTTGNPKGVVITHGSVMYECKTAELGGSTMQGVRWVSYLPLAHIAERMFTLYLAIYSAGHTYFCHVPTDLIGVVGHVKPTAFFGVPRVWEKIQAGIQALLTMEQDEAKKAAVAAAMETGREYVLSCEYGKTTSEDLAARFEAADEQVLRPIKGLLGLDQAVNVVSAAAPLPPDVAAFFAGLGMKILDVYGMTETTGAFTTNTPAAFKMGTVGRAVPGIEVKIAEDGEILARGPLNTPGYLNLPEQTLDGPEHLLI
ncbi:MAG: AMP-binding protein, partial [Nocardiopsaceae bacterium]|nr:AMP-binding protein [Nocardiopsaceae bacterium]